MKKVFFLTAIVTVLLLLPACLHSKTEKIKIRNVTIEGNNIFDDDRLLRLVLSRPSGFLNPSYYYPEILEDDLETLIIFYQQNGYLEADIADHRIVVDSTHRTAEISITISEGELTIVEGISVFGNTIFPDSVLLRFVKLRKSQPFRRNLIRNGMLDMLSLYADSGYVDALIKPDIKINPEAHLALIDFIITEHAQSSIGNIHTQGLKKTHRNIVTRELSFKEDEIIQYSKILESQHQLYLTGLFESVFIRSQTSSDGDSTRKDILIEIKEKQSSEFNISLGYGSVDRAHAGLELLSNNIAGTARQAGIGLGASFIRRGVEVSFTEPRIFDTRWRGDINTMFEFLEEPGFDVSRFNARFTIGRPLGGNSNLSLALRYEDARLRHVVVAEQPEDFDPRIRSLIITYAHDTRDNLFDPQEGTYLEWRNEIAGSFLSGDNTFARSILFIKKFIPGSDKTVFASAFEIGWMDYFGSSDEIPLSERFYAGGPNSIRGFDYQLVGPLDSDRYPLGGRFKIVWNALEIRQSLYKIFGAVFFADMGNVWTDIRDFSIDDIRPSLGIGLRVASPIGILRLDYGLNLDKRPGEHRDRFHFNMGHAF